MILEQEELDEKFISKIEENLLKKECSKDDLTELKMLIIMGADVNIHGIIDHFSHPTILAKCCLHNKKDLVELLINSGADVNFNGSGALNLALNALNGDYVSDVIKLLIENGADPNPVMRKAIADNRLNLVKYLLENGADVNYSDGYGNSPITTACHYHNVEAVKLLLEYGADININDDEPLCEACKRGNCLDFKKYLLRRGAKINDFRTLRSAIITGDLNLVKFLVRSGAEIKNSDENKSSFDIFDCSDHIVHAANDDQTKICKYLIDTLISQNKKPSLKYALYEACRLGNDKTVLLLMKYNAEVDILINKNIAYTCNQKHSVKKQLMKNGATERLATDIVNFSMEKQKSSVKCLEYDWLASLKPGTLINVINYIKRKKAEES